LIGYYDEEADMRIFAQVREVSRRGGILIIDTINRDFLISQFVPCAFTDVSDDMAILERRELDLSASRVKSTWTYYRKEKLDLKHLATVSLSVRLYSLHELANILRKAGWDVVKTYGDIWREETLLEPFKPNSRRLVIVARAI
jgi:hypothetical protein